MEAGREVKISLIICILHQTLLERSTGRVLYGHPKCKVRKSWCKGPFGRKYMYFAWHGSSKGILNEGRLQWMHLAEHLITW